MADELLDIVNKQDEVIGQKLRSEVYSKQLSNFRVVNAFLINKEGKLWIPRRTKEKRVFPSCLDASMGGHVAAGETYEKALARELMEELRIDVQNCSCKCIGSLTPHQHNTSAFMKVYVLQTDETPNYNTKDFVEFFWLKPEDVLDRLESGDRSKNDLPIIIREFF